MCIHGVEIAHIRDSNLIGQLIRSCFVKDVAMQILSTNLNTLSLKNVYMIFEHMFLFNIVRIL